MSSNNFDLNEIEEIQLKTVCEYLFFDQFKEYASFPRFEKCFQPLFNSTNISLDFVFKEICGQKRKYITYSRILSAYKNYKSGKLSNDTKYFFQKLLTNILITENCSRGESSEECFHFSTKISNSKRSYISLIEVLTDNEGIIHGLNVQYDGVFSNRMYPSKLEENLSVSLEMNLGIIDEKPILNGSINQLLGLKEKFFRDSVTHIFGTFDKEKKYLSFLGFKCSSGKTVFVGFPNGDGFLMGKFGNKLSHIKLEMTEEGITKIETFFDENIRTNFYLKNKANKIKESDKDILILEESELDKINNEDEIDKIITTPVINDDKFFNKKLEDIISGNDYKEVVNQAPRKWLMNLRGGNNKLKSGIPQPNLTDALKIYEEEKKKRGKQRILFLPNEINLQKGFNQNIMKQSILQHSRRKLNHFKRPKGKQPRFLGPKGIDPILFTHTLAGFAENFPPHGPQGNININGPFPHGPHFPHGPFPHGPHGMFPHWHHPHHRGWGMWRFGWGNWMQNQGFIPKGKNDYNEKMKQEENVYDYYGNNYFNPWIKNFENNQKYEKPNTTEKGENNIINNKEEAPSISNISYDNNEYQQYDPYGYGGYGYGYPPYGFPHGGFGYGFGQQQGPHNPPPQEQPPQQPSEEFYDMPFYDPYFGYNYQFGQNQGGENNKSKNP